MITNKTYITYVDKIASLFCLKDMVCRASTSERMKHYFTDRTFLDFLNTIENGRWYFLQFYQMSKGWWHYYWMDILTGQDGAGQWNDVFNNDDIKRYLQATFKIELKEWLADTGTEKSAIGYERSAASYGITYTPTTVPGGGKQPTPTGTGGGTSPFTPTPQPTPTGTTPETKPDTGGTGLDKTYNIAGYEIPVVLIYAGLGLFAFMQLRKK